MANPKKRGPRLQVTLSPQSMAMLDELAEVTGYGKATLISRMVDEALPMLQGMAQAHRHLKEDAPREAQQIISRVANEATFKLAQEQLSFDDALAARQKPKHQKRKKGAPSDGAT